MYVNELYPSFGSCTSEGVTCTVLPGQGGCHLFSCRIPFKINVVIAVYRAEFLNGIFDIASVAMLHFGAVFTFALLLSAPTDAVDFSYVAAVYEHNLILNPDPRVPLSRLEALQHLQKNLDIFEDQAARAAQQVLTGHERSTSILTLLMDFEPCHKFLFHCNVFIYLFTCSLPISQKGCTIFFTIVFITVCFLHSVE